MTLRGSEEAGLPPPTGQPAVSVVIPAYSSGGEQVVGRAVASVLAQTFGDLELVVVDDGSSPPTVMALSGVVDARLRILRHSPNRGAAAARNRGVAESSAPLVAFLDSDDVWNAEMLANQVAALTADSEALACTTGFALRYPNGCMETRIPADRVPLIDRAVRGCDLSPGSTLMVRRLVWDSIGGMDEGLNRLEDWDLLLRLAHLGRVVVVAKPLAEVTVNRPGPHPVTVETAVARILDRHRIQLTSARHRRRIGAAGRYEVGLARLRHGQRLRGLAGLVRAAVTDPAGRWPALRRAVGRCIGATVRTGPHDDSDSAGVAVMLAKNQVQDSDSRREAIDGLPKPVRKRTHMPRWR
ncbi:MAG: glycosyltransferase family 2 protein [Acidimicrobiales bacterium]